MPKVIEVAMMRRSSLSSLRIPRIGGTISGMKAMWIGMRFWLITPIATTPPMIPHFVARRTCSPVDSSAFDIFEISQFARSWGSPEWATAIAKAPSSA